MKIIDNLLNIIPLEFVNKNFMHEGDGIFLDIETTGLSRDKNEIYLIGTLFQDSTSSAEAHWRERFYFAESKEEEPLILQAFLDFLKERESPLFITFNGDRFDLPFLKKRIEFRLEGDNPEADGGPSSGLGPDQPEEGKLSLTPEADGGPSSGPLPDQPEEGKLSPAPEADGGPSPMQIFQRTGSLDIYQLIKPYRKVLGLKDMRQKTLEEFLGIHREDPYSGQELISVYHKYREERDISDFQKLYRHNLDDVEGMPKVLSVLSYLELFGGEHEYQVEGARIHRFRGLNGLEQEEIFLTFRLEESVPMHHLFHIVTDGTESLDSRVFLFVEKDMGKLRIPIFRGELKHYFPNYKDYYYLPDEDTAIHSSVAAFARAENRVRANASNCYTRASGRFLPQFSPFQVPEYRKSEKDKALFLKLDEKIAKDKSFWNQYLNHILQGMGQASRQKV